MYGSVKDPKVTAVHVGTEKRSSGGPLRANALGSFIVLHQRNHGAGSMLRPWETLQIESTERRPRAVC